MAKRSCDACMRRRSRCDGERPCKLCTESKHRTECTYLKPILKRGPKSARKSQPITRQKPALARLLPSMKPLRPVETRTNTPLMMVQCDQMTPLSAAMFAPILEVYTARMYPVWPVLDADALMIRLKASETNNPVDSDCFILATALAAATIAQLQLGSEDAAVQKVSAAMMETECMRLRYQYNYRNIPSVYNVLASFFLHVYHAKRNNRNAAMMHLQEAISIARILKIDRAKNNLTSCQLIHILLWVSERYVHQCSPHFWNQMLSILFRGYSMQHGMTPSICETPCVQSIDDCCYDAHQKGLLDLAQLFAAFDTELLQRTGQNSSALPPHLQETWHMETRKRLIRANEKLTRYKIRRKNWDLVQCADFYITRSWMRILLWQQAVRCGLLSSHASIESMTLMFPCIVARDLLESFTVMSRDHLVPLGRDQV